MKYVTKVLSIYNLLRISFGVGLKANAPKVNVVTKKLTICYSTCSTFDRMQGLIPRQRKVDKQTKNGGDNWIDWVL